MTPSISRIALVGILVFALEAVGFGTTTPTGASQPGAPDLTIDLPEYVVTASQVLPEPEHWRYAKIGEYEILSQTDDTTTRALAERLATMKAIVIALAGSTSAPPVTTSIILCNTDKTFREFIPQTVIKGVNLTWVDRLYLSDDFGQRTIVLKSNGVNDEARYRDLLRNYARAQLRARVPARPDWYVTGMAEIIADSNYRVESGRLTIEYGKTVAYREGIDVENYTDPAGNILIEPKPSGRAIQNAGHDLGVPRVSMYEVEKPSADALLIIGGSLNNHTTGEHDSKNTPDLENDVNAMRFNTYFLKNRLRQPSIKELLLDSQSLNSDDYRMGCWAFTHCCLFGRDGRYANNFSNFIRTASEYPDKDRIGQFETNFGKKVTTFDVVLSNYIEEIVSRGGQISVPFERRQTPLIDATPSLIGRIKGDAYKLGKYPLKAKNEFVVGYHLAKREGDKPESLLASIALLSLEEGDLARAKPLLENAVKMGVPNVSVYLKLGRIRLDNATGHPLAMSETIACLQPLLAAHETCPPYAEIYEMIAEVCLRSSAHAGLDMIDLLNEGLRYFPSRELLREKVKRLTAPTA